MVLFVQLTGKSPCFALVFIVVVLSTGCSDDNSTSTNPSLVAHASTVPLENKTLHSTRWQLIQLAFAEDYGEAQQEAITLEFDGNTLNGFSGCNTFQSHYVENGDNVTFSSPRSAMRQCLAFEKVRLERHFLKTLSMVDQFFIENNKLTLVSVGKVVIVMQRY